MCKQNSSYATFKINKPVGVIDLIPDRRSYTLKFRYIIEEVNININNEYSKSYDKSNNTLIVHVKDIDITEDISCEISSYSSIEIENSNVKISDIYKLLIDSEYTTNEKTIIWDIINNEDSLSEKITNLIESRKNVSNDLIDAVLFILGQ